MTGRTATSQIPPSEVVDQGLLDAARVLRDTLVRVHPSFRFEERLARRLAARSGGVADDALVGLHAGDVTGDAWEGAAVIPFPVPAPVGAIEALAVAFDVEGDDEGAALTAPREPTAWWGQVPRGALIGGAIASGFSIAGAALLARRWLHRAPGVAESGRGAA